MSATSTSQRSAPSILVQRLVEAATARGDELAMAFPRLDGTTTELSWRELRDAVLGLAGTLAKNGCEPGQVALVLTSTPLDQAVSFLALQACGALPSVLAYPSIKQTPAMFMRMFGPVLRDSGARIVMHSEQFGDLLAGNTGEARLLPIPDVLRPTDAAIAPIARPNDDLFWQFSSGTTGARKSVVVTTPMFASQAEAYRQTLGLGADDRVVSWVPLYHDLGLLGGFLIPFYLGVPTVQMSPFEWLQKPAMMFAALHDYRGTVLSMPNFAFAYCAQRVPAGDLPADLDLSGMKSFECGGEQVTPKAQDEFLARFAPFGVRRDQLHTIYGMAENVLGISHTVIGTERRRDRIDRATFLEQHRAVPAATGADDRDCLLFESCGRAIPDTELRIAGAQNDREVGEIQLRGGSMFSGYSASEGGAAGTHGDFTDDGWFGTGDLGYFADGELYVTGRAKDVIIHRGVNIYPADIEEAIGRMDEVRAGRVVVFGVADEALGSELVIAMLEAGRDVPEQRHPEIDAAVRDLVLGQFNLLLSDVVVVPFQTLRKSTSGKISHEANRALYLERFANRSAEVGGDGIAPRDLEEGQIAAIWCDVLGAETVAVRDDFFTDRGGDSVRAAQLVAALNEKFDTDFGPELLLDARTVERQAARVRDREGDHRVLVKLQTNGDKRPLFLAHPAGGSVFGYEHVARALPDRPVYGLQDPHIFLTGGFFESIEEMAAAYIPHLRRVQPKGPYLIGGWSLGGVLAFEIANRLLAAGESVEHLILFDAASPPTFSERAYLFRKFVPSQALLRTVANVPALRALLGGAIRRRLFAGCDDIARARVLARFDLDATPGMLALFWPHVPAAVRAAGLDAVLADAVKLSERRDNIVPGVSPSNHVQRRRIHQRNLTKLFRRYRPKWRYPGRVTLFHQPDEAVVPWRKRGWALRFGWQPYCVGEFAQEIVELRATEAQPDPHDNALLPLNTERYMPRVKTALDG